MTEYIEIPSANEIAFELVLETVDTVTAWLNSHQPLDDTELTMRLLKVSEEAGEVARAWIGVTGQNVRKGITHTRTDVVSELADVVFAALVAITSLGHNPRTALTNKALTLLARVDTHTLDGGH